MAMNALFDAGLMDGFDNIKVVALGTGDNAYLHRREEVDSMAAFDGAKIRASGNIGAKLCEAVGGTAVGKPFTSTAEALSRGIVDGILQTGLPCPVSSWRPSRAHISIWPGGGACIYLSMNQQSYERLPDSAKAVFAANGPAAFGAFWGGQLTRMNNDIRPQV